MGMGIWEDRVEEEGQEEGWGEKDEQTTTSGYVGKANDPEPEAGVVGGGGVV